jgi:16S rRNA (cytosine1402-N4)-methyltransferase
MNTHIPVLLNETLQALRPERGGVYLDATFGGGGHSRALLEAAANVRVFAVDRDPAAVPRAAALATEFPGRLEFTRTTFDSDAALAGAPFDGALIDAGVSSFQLDEAARGFSFRTDAPADMRMDPDSGFTAAAFLEEATEARLIEAVRDFGGETRWRAVVRAILAARGTGALLRTASFAALVAAAVHRPGPPPRIHPATLAFQGVRIAVNAELAALRAALPRVFAALKPGGVFVVISFHSLEDRVAKRFFNEICGRPADSNDSRPQDERAAATAESLSRRPITPSAEEAAANPRARSAKLRAVRKLSFSFAPPVARASSSPTNP